MSEIKGKFAAALALVAFGIAGFVSMMNGASIMMALQRATIAGMMFFPFALLLAVIIFDPPVKPPSMLIKPISGEKREKREKNEPKKKK